jgi:1,4-alpha-glucan branching enzyme
MKKIKSHQAIKRKRVTFSFEAVEAKAIFLAGDFNDWSPKTHPMKNDGKGVWKKAVMLFPEKYEYKFIVDGDWREDPRNDQTCLNCFGTQNSILCLTAP